MDFKKSMAIFVAALMLIGCIIPLVSNESDAADQNYFIDGGNHTDNPDGYFEITDVAGLKAIRNDLTENYILMNDIVFTESDYLIDGVVLSVGATTSGSTITVTVKYKSTSGNWTSDGVSVDVWFKGEKYTTTNGTVTTTSGKYTNGDPYFVSVTGTLDQKDVAASVYSPNATAASIEINSTGNFEMLGNFSGILDGNGYAIKGMNVVGVNSNAAMFEKISGTVKNLGLVDVYASSVGVISQPEAGGFALGLDLGSTIQNCFVTGNVLSSALVASSESYVGGIVTTSLGTITDTYMAGAVAGMTLNGNSYAGGITSYMDAEKTEGCYNSGTVLSESYSDGSNPDTANVYAGGIVGRLQSGIITSSHNTGAVKALSNGTSYAGGVLGLGSVSTSIYSNYNNGAITSVTENKNKDDVIEKYQAYAGGVAGKVDTIFKCYNTGTVSAKATSTGTSTPVPTSQAYAGGIAGSCLLVYNSYSSVSYTSVTATSGSLTSDRAFKGGISGIMQLNGALVNCYYLAPSSGSSKLYSNDTENSITVDDNKPGSLVLINIDYDTSLGSVTYSGFRNTVPVSGSGPGVFVVTNDTEVTITATAGTDCVFSAWDGLDTNKTPATFTTDGNMDVRAVFLKAIDGDGNPAVTNLTVTCNPDTGGTVKYTVTDNKGGDDEYSYSGTVVSDPLVVKKGTEVILEAIPKTDYAFKNWTDEGSILGTSNPWTFIAGSDQSMTANFDVSTGGPMFMQNAPFGDVQILADPPVPNPVRSDLQRSGAKTADQLKSYNTYFEGYTKIWSDAKTIYGWSNTVDPGAKWTKTNAAGGTSDPSENNNYPYLEGLNPGHVYILSNPASQTVKSGDTATFSITAVSDVKMSFTWQSNTSISDSGWSTISGATSDTYSLTSSTSAEKYYRCRISVSVGGSTYYTYSDAAKLSVPVEIRTLDDLMNINKNLGGTYVQKADLYFVKDDTTYNKNGGTDITLTPSIDDTNLVLKFTYVNSNATVGVPSLTVWMDGVKQSILTDSNGVVSIAFTNGSHKVVIGGAVEGNSVAISYDLTISGGNSVSVAIGTKSSNGLFDPIGTSDSPFTGSYDGNGYKIYGLETGVTAGSGSVASGLFGYASSDSVIKNVAIESGSSLAIVQSDVDTAFAGGVVGSTAGTVTGCHNNGTVTAITAVTGGTSVAAAGGIAGYALGTATISQSYNTGSVSAFGTISNAGGIMGDTKNDATATIVNCYNTGAIKSDVTAGGIIGAGNASTVTNCYSTGGISATNKGGIMGTSTNGFITNCYFLDTSGPTDLSGSGSGTYTKDGTADHGAQASGAKTDGDMKSKSTYYTGTTTVNGEPVTGWDFTSGNVWIMSDGSLPGLKAATPVVDDDDDDGGINWTLIVGIVAAALAVILIGYVLLKRRKA